MSESSAPRCLCIVSGDPVRSGELLDALRPMVDTHDVEIIVDRRRGESDDAPDQPEADRRHQPSVDVRLKLYGFAIVSDPSPSLTDPSFDGALAGAPLDEADPDEPELRSVLEFNRQRKGRRRRRLALALLLGATLAVLLLTLVPTMKALMSATRPGAPPVAESSSTIALPPPLAPIDVPPQSASPQSDESLRSPEPTPPAVKEPTPLAAKEPTPPAVKEPTPPAAKRASRPRAKPPGSPPMRQANELVRAAPAPKAVQSPEVAPPSPPAEGTAGRGPAAQAATAAEVAAPPAQIVPSAPPVASVPAPPAQIAPSTPPVASVPSPEPGRSPEAAPTGQAPTATIPDASPAPSASSPSDRHVGGLGDQFKNLGKVMERDVTEATADAKRQGDDFKAIQNRFRRAWDGLKQGFFGPPEKSGE